MKMQASLAAAETQMRAKVLAAIEAYEAAYEELCSRDECISRALAALAPVTTPPAETGD